jgi:hypothetical protein
VVKIYYNRDQHTVTFKADENVVKEETLKYGANITAPDTSLIRKT